MISARNFFLFGARVRTFEGKFCFEYILKNIFLEPKISPPEAKKIGIWELVTKGNMSFLCKHKV